MIKRNTGENTSVRLKLQPADSIPFDLQVFESRFVQL